MTDTHLFKINYKTPHCAEKRKRVVIQIVIKILTTADYDDDDSVDVGDNSDHY